MRPCLMETSATPGTAGQVQQIWLRTLPMDLSRPIRQTGASYQVTLIVQKEIVTLSMSTHLRPVSHAKLWLSKTDSLQVLIVQAIQT